MNNLYVIKRNGKKESFNISKIKHQIEFVCKNTNINPVELEASLKLYLTDGIKTSDIQKAILLTAKTKVSADEPDWSLVAGRIATWDIYGTVYKNTGYKFKHWLSLMKELVKDGYYKQEILDKLKEFNIRENDINYGSWGNINFDNPDFHKIIPQVLIYLDKYIIKNQFGPIEYPFMIHIANAALLADNRSEFFDYYKKLSENFISLATPFLGNLRLPNGNTGSCFIGQTDDCLASIVKSFADISFISKEGGGIGWDVTPIRPGNTYSQGVVKSNNIIKWTKIYNDIIVAVNQKGKRKGSITLGMAWWHLDINDFLEAKSTLKQDLRNKTFDIFPQIVLDNYFVDAWYDNRDVYLFNHYTFKQKTGIDVTTLVDEDLYKAHEIVEDLIKKGEFENTDYNTNYIKINPRDFFKKILWIWVEVGEIYITHIDNLNKSNYIKYDNDPERRAITPMGNLCIESYSVVKRATKWKEEVENGKRVTTETDGMYHSCNLTSLNLVKFINRDESFIKDTVSSAVKMLDKSIDLGTFPVKEASISANNLRNVGLGFLGMADWMAYYGYSYNKPDGIKAAMKLTETIAYYAYQASIELAKEKGAYPWFKAENYDKLFGLEPEILNNISKNVTGNNYDWCSLVNDIKVNGIRNFYLLALAPNTSTGLAMGVSPSYLPIFTKDGTQELANMVTPILPVFIKDKRWHYKTRYQYKPQEIVRFTRAIQTFIDTGISMEVNLNKDLFTMDELGLEFMEGFKTGELKGIYYNRSVDGCTDCAN